MSEKLYLKMTPAGTSKIDTVYYQLNEKETTWGEVLDLIESNLDGQYLYNNPESLLGIKLEIEIVNKIPEDVEFDDEQA